MKESLMKSETYNQLQFLPHHIEEALFQFSMRYGLTPRESEILALITGFGLTNCEIAERFTISEKTVKNHITNIFTKLGIRSMRKLLPLLIHEAFVNEIEEFSASANSLLC